MPRGRAKARLSRAPAARAKARVSRRTMTVPCKQSYPTEEKLLIFYEVFECKELLSGS